MRNLKKFLALVLAMMMTLSLMVTVNASSFSDDKDITTSYQEAIDVLTELGVINGYSDGTFLPKESITRAEVAAIIYRITTGDVSGKNAYRYENADYFTDVLDGKWYNGYVNYCANNGLVLGVGNNRFEPSSPVTGYQALVMILRAMGYNNPQEFSTSDWKFKASGYGTRLGITKNIATGSLSGEATREMVAEIMFQAIQKPTVKYSILNDYTENVLVKAYQNANGWVYDKDVYETLLYRTFQIVGKRTILGSDGTYGRPVVEWVKDAPDDTVENGGLYIVNPQASGAIQDATTLGKPNGVKGGLAVDAGAVYVPSTTPGATYGSLDDPGNPTKFEVSSDEDEIDVTDKDYNMRPVYTFNTAMTECDLSKAINNDTTIAWKNITEYVNGNKAVNRDTVDNGAKFDALHTTNTGTNNTTDYTIGAQGRQTEIYKLDGGKWIFVYIDTLLGQVVKTVPHTEDTNGHIMKQAELWIAVNDKVNADAPVIAKRNKDYTQQVGDLVLLTTYGLKDETATGTGSHSAVEVNYGILLTFPGTNGADTDLKVASGAWAVDLASDTVGENAVVPQKTITVTATIGLTADKDGVIADGTRYPTTWLYHVDHGFHWDTDGTTPLGRVTDEHHTMTGMSVDRDTVLNSLYTNVTNQIIGQTYTAALDKNGNIVGMWPGSTSTMYGVLTDVDYARIGLGKYAVEFEIFTENEKTETIRMLDAGNNFNYYASQEAADYAINDTNNAERAAGLGHDNVMVGSLVKLESYTKDGATYWKLANIDDHTETISTVDYVGESDTDDTVVTGKSNTLVGGTNHTAYELNNDSVIFVAEYDFGYNQGSGNQGANYNVRYKVYKNFRNIPCIDASGATDNIFFQVLDNVAGDEEYCLIGAVDPDLKYTMKTKQKIAVDDSFLVLAADATYADHSDYFVAKNGAVTTISVANVNDSVNEKLHDNIRTGNLLVATGTNTRGYITDVDLLQAGDPNLGGESNTIIEKNTSAKVSKGVLKWDTTHFLTVADNCVVKIANVDNGKLYDATLASVEQYANQDMAFELDADGYVSYIYIID